jgi:signal transduction histidine kinase
MLRANVLKRLIHESLLLAPDLASFKRQESTFVVLNLFVLAILLLTQSLFSSYLGTPSSLLVAVLGLGFLLNVLEMLWLRRLSSINANQVLTLTWCSILLNMMLAFALASLSNRRDAQYFALMALPVVQAAFRLPAVPTATVVTVSCLLNIFWVWHFFHLHPPVVVGEYVEAGTVSLIYLLVGTLVWSLVHHLRSTHTSLERSLAELKQTRERLLVEEKLAAVGRLSSAIAHEIRNPVAMISSALDTALKNSLKPQDREEMFGIAARESGRLVTLTTDFLTYARPRMPEKHSADAAESIAYVAEVCGPHATANAVTIQVETPERLQTNMDSGQVQQALLNLVKNAIEASAPGGIVFVRGRRQGDRIRVDIENSNGPMPHDTAERVFEPFFTTKPSGTGLGLAIARNIVRGHGGELSLSCNQPDSVRFSITLPAYGDKSDERPRADAAANESRNSPASTAPGSVVPRVTEEL